jgi:hypothetical protein
MRLVRLLHNLSVVVVLRLHQKKSEADSGREWICLAIQDCTNIFTRGMTRLVPHFASFPPQISRERRDHVRAGNISVELAFHPFNAALKSTIPVAAAGLVVAEMSSTRMTS